MPCPPSPTRAIYRAMAFYDRSAIIWNPVQFYHYPKLGHGSAVSLQSIAAQETAQPELMRCQMRSIPINILNIESAIDTKQPPKISVNTVYTNTKFSS